MPFITVDELRPDKTCRDDCTTIVKGLIDRGLEHRVAFYFSYSPSNPNWADRSGIITACGSGACRLAFETYPSVVTTTQPPLVTVALQGFRDSIAKFGNGNAAAIPTWGLAPSEWNNVSHNLAAADAWMQAARTVDPDWHGCALYGAPYVGPTSAYTLPQAVASLAASVARYYAVK